MSIQNRSLISVLLAAGALQAAPPNPAAAAQMAMQQNMQMQRQMQMQMQMQASRAAAAAYRARQQQHSERNGGSKEPAAQVARPAGEAWRSRRAEDTWKGEGDGIILERGSGWLRAISRDKGEDLWSFAVASLEQRACAAQGLVLLVTQDYRLLLLDRDTGRTKAEVQLDKLGNFLMQSYQKPRVQTPVLHGGCIYVATYGKGQDGEPSGKLYALDASTGAKVWEGSLASGAEHPPVIADGRIIVGGSPWLQAFQLSDGKPLWKVDTGAGTWLGMGGTDAERYYVATGKKLLAVDLAKGEIAWQNEGAWNFAVLAGKRVLALRSRTFGAPVLAAMDAATGKPVWERPSVRELPWTTEDRLVLVEDNKVRCLSVLDGTQAWELPVKGDPSWVPSLSGDQVFIASRDGKTTHLQALDLATGKEAWTFPVKGKVLPDLCVLDGSGILVETKDGELVALK